MKLFSDLDSLNLFGIRSDVGNDELMDEKSE